MGRITVDLLRRRAEHNDKNLATLQEITLHQQNIERIELINQLCRNLKILYLQNNVICKIEKLNRLKDLENLNLAVNNIAKVQNLQRCESLRKLDLTVNFVDKAGLLSVASLKENEFLEELFLVGNPCTKWPGYRRYVVGLLPRLKRLDSEDVLPSERIQAQQQWPTLHAQLRQELLGEGVDPDAAAEVEDDSLLEAEEIPETGYIDDKGELRRPWCRETRILEHREQEREIQAAEERRQGEQRRLFTGKGGLWEEEEEPKPREGFPPLVDGEPVYQKNEGTWEFSLGESADGLSVVLDVDVGRYLDTSLIQADVQTTVVRLLIKGRLLQLLLPQEVRPDFSVAQRSKTTGHLVLTMPKEHPEQAPDVTRTRGPQPAQAVTPLGMCYGAAHASSARRCNEGRGGGGGRARPTAMERPSWVLWYRSRACAPTLDHWGPATAGPRGRCWATGGATVWEMDAEGKCVERPLQKAGVVLAGAGAGEEGDEPPPL